MSLLTLQAAGRGAWVFVVAEAFGAVLFETGLRVRTAADARTLTVDGPFGCAACSGPWISGLTGSAGMLAHPIKTRAGTTAKGARHRIGLSFPSVVRWHATSLTTGSIRWPHRGRRLRYGLDFVQREVADRGRLLSGFLHDLGSLRLSPGQDARG